MSKTKEKRSRRNLERLEFLLKRRQMQLDMFEQAVAVGIHLYEENKDKLPAEDIEQLEALRKQNEAYLDQAREEVSSLQKSIDEANQDLKA